MKNIVAPKVADYPAMVSGVAFSIGDDVRKGDRLCVLTFRSGRKIAINAPISGQIRLLLVRDAQNCMEGQLIAGIEEAVVPDAPEPPRATEAHPEPEPTPPEPAQPEPAAQNQKMRTPRPPRRKETPPPAPPPRKQINFLLWQGWGWLVPIVYVSSAFVIFALMAVWLDGDAEPLIYSKWLQALTFLTPAFFVGWFGLWTNIRKSAVADNRVSKFLFLRSEYWAVPLAIMAIGGMVFIDGRLKEREEANAMMAEIAAQLAIAARESRERAEEAAAEAYHNATYSFTLCNDTNEVVNAAVAIKDNGDDEHMRMRSWFNVPRGGCLRPFTGRFGDTSEIAVYYHALTPDWSTWGGRNGAAGTINFCLPATNEDFLLNTRKRCRGELELRTFRIRTLTRENPSIRMSLGF